MAAVWECTVLTHTPQLKGVDYERIESELNDLGRQGGGAVSTVAPSFGAGQVIERP